MLFEYFYGREADKFMFYRIPKLLFELAGLKDMPVESKVMYGILLDRVGLSVENGWIDKEGRVYIIYTIPEAAAALGCSERKAFEIVKELESRRLVEKKRRGMGKPNLIYVKNFLTEMQNLQPNNNYKNNTDKDNVKRFIRLTYLLPQLLDMVDERKLAFNPAVEEKLF